VPVLPRARRGMSTNSEEFALAVYQCSEHQLCRRNRSAQASPMPAMAITTRLA